MSNDRILEFSNNDLLPALYGEYNDHLSYIEKKLHINISDRGNVIRVTGAKNDAATAEKILRSLYDKLDKKELMNITHADIDAEIRFANAGDDKNKKKNGSKSTANVENKNYAIKTKNKLIAPRSPNQREYIELLNSCDVVFGLGPAGTGKTYISVAAAIDMYLQGKIEKLIFTRPAVEAGENLGFLPGDMKEKIDPYLRPIYDALQDMLPHDFLMKKMEIGEIEIAPLAFMRGRTLANAFVILDEAQNTTCSQMKMFLTRMGENSRMVITGDASQTDLPKHVTSGLHEAIEVLSGVEGIGMMTFDADDVIRNPMVRKIIKAYDKHNK